MAATERKAWVEPRHHDPYGTLKMGPSWGGGPSEEEQLGHRAFLRSKGYVGPSERILDEAPSRV